jgi:regulator of sirC expression with transglutaminase-like and TPR domain
MIALRCLVVFLTLALCCTTTVCARKKSAVSSSPQTEENRALEALLGSLDPRCVSQHLALYELYPQTEEGKRALKTAWHLLGGDESALAMDSLILSPVDVGGLIALVTRQPSDAPVSLSEAQLQVIDALSKDLSNRALKGHHVWSRAEALALNNEEVDLARSLFLFQFDTKEPDRESIRHYEALLDFMALQIRARLNAHASNEEKVREISRFIFEEMRFRFPPQSLHAADIDLYTFLPSVLDGRQGVCLGVSILYLSLAQRLDLPLEVITPPGHIYVRYRDGKKTINIETTARGIDLPSETYLGVNTRKLQQRKLKEVIGLAFMNQAAVFWGKSDHSRAVSLYEKAQLFMPNDPLLKMFLGFNYAFIGKTAQGKALLREVRNLTLDEAVSSETLPEDYLSGKVDAEGVKAIFLPVDETHTSIIEKQKQLQAIVKRHPRFRAGLLQLATTYLQLGRIKEARASLEQYHAIDPHSSIVEYYLTVLCLMELDYNPAWMHFRKLETLIQARKHTPKLLFSLKEGLLKACPE